MLNCNSSELTKSLEDNTNDPGFRQVAAPALQRCCQGVHEVLHLSICLRAAAHALQLALMPHLYPPKALVTADQV